VDTSTHKVCQTILHKNDLVLVQWLRNGSPSRAWITPDMIVEQGDGQQIVVEYPEGGIPFGEEWSRMVTLQATERDLEKNLRLQGVWTVEDAQSRPDAVRAALQATYGLDAAALLRAVKEK